MIATEPRFRLLDPFTGWDLALTTKIDGAGDDRGLRLAGSNVSLPQLTREELDRFLSPPWLAPGDRPGAWIFLGTSADSDRPRVYSRDRCEQAARDITPLDFDAVRDGEMTGLAYWRGKLAVAVKTEHECVVILWGMAGARLATLRFPVDAKPLPAFAPWGELVILARTDGRNKLHRYNPVGEPRGAVLLEAKEKIERIARGADGAIWFAAEAKEREERYDLWRVRFRVVLPKPPQTCDIRVHWRQKRITSGFLTPDQVRERVQRAIPVAGPTIGRVKDGGNERDTGFCLTEPDCKGGTTSVCFTRKGGTPAKPGEVVPAIAPTPRPALGWAVTHAIDSYLPRCRWHRVRVEVDLPPGTAVRVAVASSDRATPLPVGNPLDPAYPGDDLFHTTDWQRESRADFLIEQPPGRYLFVALELRGTTDFSPVVRRVRLDFPRATSLDRLPAVYREDPEAEDFTERFLSLFDASIEEFDRAIERFPALLDPAQTPVSALEWLGGFLGVELDPAWPVELHRTLVRTAAAFGRRRGTLAGLGAMLEAVFGIPADRVLVREVGSERPWGAIGGHDLHRPAVLGSVRLFPQRGGRFRLGRSKVGLSALRSDGDPAADITRVGAYRVSVFVPDSAAVRGPGEEALRRVVRESVPGHVVESVRVGSRGFVLGQRSVLGIDTAFTAAPPATLGKKGARAGTAVLNRWAVLHAGRSNGSRGLRVGEAMVAIHTVLE